MSQISSVESIIRNRSPQKPKIVVK